MNLLHQVEEDLKYIRGRVDIIFDKLENKVDRQEHKDLKDRVRKNEQTLIRHRTVGSVIGFLLGVLGVRF